jgi:hypothetical protein
MENNIFIKNKKGKHNPDIENKLHTKESERNATIFNLTNSIYNPVTGIIPSQISSMNDLVLQVDNPYTQNDIKNLIMNKESERQNQDAQFKPLQTKITPVVSGTNPSKKENYIETYEELKKSSTNNNKQSKEKYNNILDGLKDLGIIK